MLNVNTPASKEGRSGLAWFRLGIWKLERVRGGYERGRCPQCAGRGKTKPSIVEMFRNEDVETGAPEEQMATHRRTNSTQGNTYCQKYH